MILYEVIAADDNKLPIDEFRSVANVMVSGYSHRAKIAVDTEIERIIPSEVIRHSKSKNARVEIRRIEGFQFQMWVYDKGKLIHSNVFGTDKAFALTPDKEYLRMTQEDRRALYLKLKNEFYDD